MGKKGGAQQVLGVQDDSVLVFFSKRSSLLLVVCWDGKVEP